MSWTPNPAVHHQVLEGPPQNNLQIASRMAISQLPTGTLKIASTLWHLTSALKNLLTCYLQPPGACTLSVYCLHCGSRHSGFRHQATRINTFTLILIDNRQRRTTGRKRILLRRPEPTSINREEAPARHECLTTATLAPWPLQFGHRQGYSGKTPCHRPCPTTCRMQAFHSPVPLPLPS